MDEGKKQNKDLMEECIAKALNELIENKEELPRKVDFSLPGCSYYRGIVSLVKNTYRNCIDLRAGTESDEIICSMNVEHFETLEEVEKIINDSKIIDTVCYHLTIAEKKLDEKQ